MPTLGARFDLHKVGTEQNCWQVFWGAVKPDQIKGASLYEGSVHRGDYCIALQSADPAVVEIVRHSLSCSHEFKESCCEEPFLEGDLCTAIPLPRTGRVDENGNLIGDDKRMSGQVTAPVPNVTEEGVSLDVLESASTVRIKPASERTHDLPELHDFEGFEKLVKSRFIFHRPGYDRDIWITPKELCDVVEHYADLIEVGLSTHDSDRSENALRVRLFGKSREDVEPIELEGLYMFKTRYAVTQFLNSFISTPAYSDALPDLAGIIGRFHLHFGQPRYGEARTKAPDYSREERIAPAELWHRLVAIRETFGEELNRAVDSLRRRREIELTTASPLLQQPREEPAEVPEPQLNVVTEEKLAEIRARKEAERLAAEEELNRRRMEIELERATQDIRRSQGRCIFCGKPLGFLEKRKDLDRHKDCWEYEPE